MNRIKCLWCWIWGHDTTFDRWVEDDLIYCARCGLELYEDTVYEGLGLYWWLDWYGLRPRQLWFRIKRERNKWWRGGY